VSTAPAITVTVRVRPLTRAQAAVFAVLPAWGTYGATVGELWEARPRFRKGRMVRTVAYGSVNASLDVLASMGFAERVGGEHERPRRYTLAKGIEA
jgi:hypothetical protein